MARLSGNAGVAGGVYSCAYSNDVWTRVTAGNGLRLIAAADPIIRDDVVAALTQQLEEYLGNDEELNGLLVNDLVELQAREAAPVMERAFAADQVDELVMGDWEDVQVQLGLLSERQTPRRRPQLFKEPKPVMSQQEAEDRRHQAKAKATARAKRKRSKASKKRRRRRK